MSELDGTAPGSVTVAAVGDLQLGDSPTTVGSGFYSRYAGKPIDGLFAETKTLLANADIVFGNLETVLVPPPPGETSRRVLQMRGQASFASDLARVGFTVVNVANNHAVQHGDDVFHASVKAVRAAGIACCGIRGAGEWATEPVRFSIRNTQVAVAAYCLRPRQYGAGTPPYAEGGREEICADVRRLREEGNTVIVSLHWGEEFVPQPSTDEIALGHAIVDAGAALIIGHHPHVTRPAERRNSAVIAYSLGNFMGDMTWYAPFRRGAVLRCTVNGTATTNAAVTPTQLENDLHAAIAAESTGPLAAGSLVGLSTPDYTNAIADTWRRQRIAAYADAVTRIPRTPLSILFQLVSQTVRNKLLRAR